MHLPVVSLFSSHAWWWAAWLRACRCKPGTLPCLRQRLKLCGTGYKGEQAKRAQPVFILKIIRCLVYRNRAGRICPKLIWQAWLSSGGGFIRRDSYSLGCFFSLSKFGKWICITSVNRIKILRGYSARWIANYYNEVGKSMHECKITSVLSDSLWSHCSPSGYSVHWILQTRTLEWVAMPSSRGSSPPRGQTRVS